jgi:iron complex outermembrane receptor protein
MFSQRKSVSQVAGYPLQSATQPTFPVYIDKDNYFNPYGNQVAGAGAGQDLYFARRTIELPRVTDNESRTLHIDAALEGDFSLRGLPWNWSAGYNYNKVSGSTLGTGNLNLLNLKKALGPSFMNNGTVQCGTPANPIPLAECVPFDILGGPSASSPAALAYINSTGQATYGSTVRSATADIGGELFTLPAGALGFAAGLDRPGQFEQSGYSTDLAGNPTVGKYTVKEAYAELNIPVLKNVPFAELLSFNLASRYSDYSNFGDTTNSKASFMWKPIKDLLARGTYAQGFRAPNVGDTFGGGQQSYDYYLDPCDSVYGQAVRDPATRARCAAVVPAGFRQVNQSGTPITSAIEIQGNSPFMSGAGNASLTPEKAVTRTLGLVYSPSFVPGFTAALDWYSIKVNNRITGVEATYVANQCYVYGVDSFCGAIQRNPATGEIVNLAHGNANLGQLKTEGVDLALNYRLPRTRFGQFSLRSETTYVDTFSVKSAADSKWEEYAGEYFYNRVKSNLNLDWSLGNWSATWGMRYLSAVKDQCWDVEALIECSMPTAETATWGTGANRLGAVVYHDLNVGYKTSWKGNIQVGVNNIFDKKARTVYQSDASAAKVDANMPIDRFVYVRYSQAF